MVQILSQTSICKFGAPNRRHIALNPERELEEQVLGVQAKANEKPRRNLTYGVQDKRVAPIRQQHLADVALMNAAHQARGWDPRSQCSIVRDLS